MIKGVRSVVVGVTDLEAAADFYSNVWNLTPVTRQDDAAWFRGTAHYHHILALRVTPRPVMLNVVLDVGSRDDVDSLHAAIVAAGIRDVEKPGAVAAPGGGYGFGCLDPEGRGLGFVTGVDDHAEAEPKADRVHKITHVNYNTPDMEKSFAFFTEVLGFRLSDETAFRFLRCDSPDHSSIVLAPGKAPTLNHIAFELPDLESVMRGAGRMRDNGYPIEWGPGRHSAACNVFAYFAGPEELPLEYTAEVAQIDDSYQPRGPDYWRFPPGRSDQWGVTNPRSARFARLQQLFRFDQDGYHLTSPRSRN